MKKLLIVAVLLVATAAEARFSRKNDGTPCPGSSQNCKGADIDAWAPPAGGGWMCCAYYAKVQNPIPDGLNPQLGSGPAKAGNKSNVNARVSGGGPIKINTPAGPVTSGGTTYKP